MLRPFQAMLVAVALAPASVLLAEPKVETRVVAPARSINQGTRYFISPVDAHLVTITGDDNRFVVIHDGQKGPPFDVILEQNGLKYSEQGKGVLLMGDTDTDQVVFSDDGKHWAYAGRSGNGIAVMLDGKELAKINAAESNFRGLFFVPGSDRLYWNVGAQQAVGTNFPHRFVLHGEAGPVGAFEPHVKFSRDGKRHAYVMARVEDHNKKFLVVDGKEASYFGESPVFTGDNRLVTIQPDANKTKFTLLIDGQPQYSSVAITQVYTAPNTGTVAAIVSKPEVGANVLMLDGKEVEGSEGVTEVTFSPDGKRYAARGQTPQSMKFLIIDGRRTPDMMMGDSWFTADSSKLVFIGSGGGKQFVGVNDMQGEGFMTIYPPVFSPDGKRFAYTALAEPGKTVAVIEEVMLGPVAQINGLMWSPDGSRYAFIASEPAQNSNDLIIDGEPVERAYGGPIPPGPVSNDKPPVVVFSRDGKHVAYVGVPAQPGAGQILIVDGKPVPIAGMRASRGVFTPDGNHFYWVTWATPKYTVWLDGKEVGSWQHNPDVASTIDQAKNNWHVGDDGTLTFLAPEGKEIKRVRVTPDGSTSLATMFAGLADAEANAIADAKAAAEKAQADAKAAADKAAADAAKAKADAEAAAADRKKAFDEAIAAKAKARQEAAEAKRKAREEALRKARGGH